MKPCRRTATSLGGTALACALAIALNTSVFADTHYVATNGLHQAPYTNWVMAATNIQDAVNAASTGDSVLVSNGIYKLSATIYSTTLIYLKSANGPEYTIVDGNNAVLCFDLWSANCTIQGFTITGGSNTNDGGGICFLGTQLRNCIITNNTTTGSGGGVWCNAGAEIRNCIISGNTAGGGGGGVYNQDNAVIENCIISGNYAQTLRGGGYTYSVAALLSATA